MTDEKHIIRRAVVELYIPSANNAIDLQNKTLSFFKEKICPMIERIVAGYADTAETIRIDKLELDLKNFKPGDANEDGLRRLEEQLEEKIIKLISEERSDNFSGETVTAVKKVSKEKADEELLLHLLKTGSLPWWAKTEQTISFEKLVQKVLQQPSSSFKKELITTLAIPSVRKRIAYRLPSDVKDRIILLVADAGPELVDHIHSFLKIIGENSPAARPVTQQLYEYALMYPVTGAYRGSSLFTVPSAFRLFITGFLKDKNDLPFVQMVYNRLISKMTPADAVDGDMKTIRLMKEALADTDVHFSGGIKKMFRVADVKQFFDLEEDQKTPGKSKDKNKAAKEDGLKKKTAEDENIKAPPKKNVISQKPKGKADETDFLNDEDNFTIPLLPGETGDYFIKNSGLIIICPYLPALFSELGLCEGRKFVSEEAKERAVFLIQYLAAGNEEGFEEHEMILNKVICGMEVMQPLTLQFKISEREKEECLGLLQAVADNWPALKGTSGTGMRDAFFMRDGILEQQSNGWNLKIEKTTIDILLDKLPWGISIIQMPWSAEMIFVS